MKKSVFLLLFGFSIAILFSCTKSSYGLTPYTNTMTYPSVASTNSITIPGTSTNTIQSGYSVLSLKGTKWCLYQYKDASIQNPITISDTLVFIDSVNYQYNNQSHEYHLLLHNSTGQLYLDLYDTPFGDIRGNPVSTFISYGEILDAPFTQLGLLHPKTYSLWMRKI